MKAEADDLRAQVDHISKTKVKLNKFLERVTVA